MFCLTTFCVARPGGRAEIDETPAAKAEIQKELGRLCSKYVWDEDHPREWDDARVEARRGGAGGDCALRIWDTFFVLGIFVEKNSEPALALRKFKGRVVFQGSRVFDQNYNHAICQDLGALRVTVQAAKAVSFFGRLPGHALKLLMQNKRPFKQTWKATPRGSAFPQQRDRHGGARFS